MTVNHSEITADRFYNLTQTVAEIRETSNPFHRAVVQILANGYLNSVPVSPMIRGLAEEQFRWQRFLLLRWVHSFEEGVSIDNTPPTHDPVESLQQHRGILPDNITLQLTLAQTSGNLETLLQMLHDDFQAGRGIENQPSQMLGYIGLAFKSLFILFFCGFIAIKIVPEFKELLEEFEIQLPWAFWLFSETLNQVAKWWFLIVLAAFALFWFGAPSLRDWFRSLSPHGWRRQVRSKKVDKRQALAALAHVGRMIPGSLQDSNLPKVVARFSQPTADLGDDNSKLWDRFADDKVIPRLTANQLNQASSDSTRGWLLRRSAIRQQSSDKSRSNLQNNMVVLLVNLVLVLLVLFACLAIVSTLTTIITEL